MKKTLLVVDDETNVVELLKAIFQEEQFKIITAYSGKEALDVLKRVKPDLILLDIMMPGMSGFDVCEKIRENPKTKNIKIIFLTALKLSAIDEKYLKNLNTLDYIVKPFDNDELIKRIKKAFD